MSIPPDTGGASRFWTSDLPTIASARELVLSGKLKDAEVKLKALAPDPVADDGQQMIRWIRREYSVTPNEALTKIRKVIPTTSADDIARWIRTGDLQSRTLDGEIRVYRGEPTNLLLFCDEAKRRRTPPPDPGPWKLTQHIARAVSAAKKQGRPDVVPIRHRMTYSIAIDPKVAELNPGSLIRAWLPFPQTTQQQTKVYLVSTTPADGKVAPEHVPHRTVYFEQRFAGGKKPVKFTVVFEWQTSAWVPNLTDALAATAAATTRPVSANADVAASLVERPPHIAFTPELKSAVADAIGSETNPLAKARAIFHWVDAHIPWNSQEEYGIVPSLVRHALSKRRGDCGVQGMLFIAMCRFAGIPARWQTGWQTRRSGAGMHDWTEFYVEPWGWLPCDPSYGVQKSDDPNVRDFYFGHLDAYRLIVNTDYGRPLSPPKTSLRSEPVDFQRGEVEVDGRNLYFDQWDWDIDVKWLDEGP